MVHRTMELLEAGLDAMKFVNSTRGRELNLRGINAKVVRPGSVRTGDVAKKIR